MVAGARAGGLVGAEWLSGHFHRDHSGGGRMGFRHREYDPPGVVDGWGAESGTAFPDDSGEGNHQAIRPVHGGRRAFDLEVPDGTVCGLLGPNGAGKTTTMRMITGMLPPDEGSLRVAGYAMPARSAGGAGPARVPAGIGSLVSRDAGDRVPPFQGKAAGARSGDDRSIRGAPRWTRATSVTSPDD